MNYNLYEEATSETEDVELEVEELEETLASVIIWQFSA